jgi:hypothetical protein
VVDRGFEPRSGQTKDYQIGICCFSAKHASLRSKSKDWLARNQDNVSEWSDMSIRGLLKHRILAKNSILTPCMPLKKSINKTYILNSPTQKKSYSSTASEGTGWLGIRIMCPSGATCLSVDCCFSGLAL